MQDKVEITLIIPEHIVNMPRSAIVEGERIDVTIPILFKEERVLTTVGVSVEQLTYIAVATFTFGDGQTRSKSFPVDCTQDEVCAWILQKLSKSQAQRTA